MAVAAVRRAGAPVLIIVVVIAWAGCSQTPALDMKVTEETIATRLADGYGVEVDRVQCPKSVSAKSGRSFACQARLDVGTVTVKAKITDADGALTLTPDRARIDVSAVSTELSTRLSEQTDPVLVACEGAPVRLVPVGSTFSCRAGNGKAQRTVEVTVRDWRGGVDFALP